MVFWVRELGEGELLIRVIPIWMGERERKQIKKPTTHMTDE